MKNSHPKAVLLSAAILFSITTLTFPQKSVFTSNKGILIGFGTGLSYQCSDIPNSSGGGFDFVFGSYLRKRENEFLAVDWKFRFVAGDNRAYDHRVNSDGTYSNIRYAFFNYDAEIGLTLNRLLERTRIVVTGFAGAGMTHGRTFTDLLDKDGNLYDYSGINPAGSRKEILTDLRELTDGDFETKLRNKGAIMPTAGIFIGYQFSKSFCMGLEHKVSFSLTENNSAFGIDIDNRVVNGSSKDKNNYTSLVFRWALSGGGRAGQRSSAAPATGSLPAQPSGVKQPARPVPEQYPPVSIRPPEVDIINPSENQTKTQNPAIRISARVFNVTGIQNVEVIHNGKKVPFDFNPETGLLYSTLTLSTGSNTLIISATNEAGNSRDNATIIFSQHAPAALPSVRFVNPSSPVSVRSNVFPLEAMAVNVTRWDDITLKINGETTYNYSFSNDGRITMNIGLREGKNIVEITVRNEAGSASERTVITYTRTVKPVTQAPAAEPAPVAVPVAEQPPVTVEKQEQPQEQKPQPVPVQQPAAEPAPVGAVATEQPPVTVEKQEQPQEQKPQPVPVQQPAAEPVPVAVPVAEPVPVGVVAAEQPPVTVEKQEQPQEQKPEPLPVQEIQQVPVYEAVQVPVQEMPPVNEEKPCGVRINPGNADWQFCMITPAGTFNRDTLRRSTFAYTGLAQSLFFMPTAGGGDAVVNGKPYPLRPGQYYLFTGNLKVTVSTRNPGSMGQWSVCIEADREPVSGTGNNRPVSPCEKEDVKDKRDQPADKPSGKKEGQPEN